MRALKAGQGAQRAQNLRDHGDTTAKIATCTSAVAVPSAPRRSPGRMRSSRSPPGVPMAGVSTRSWARRPSSASSPIDQRARSGSNTTEGRDTRASGCPPSSRASERRRRARSCRLTGARRPTPARRARGRGGACRRLLGHVVRRAFVSRASGRALRRARGTSVSQPLAQVPLGRREREHPACDRLAAHRAAPRRAPPPPLARCADARAACRRQHRHGRRRAGARRDARRARRAPLRFLATRGALGG